MLAEQPGASAPVVRRSRLDPHPSARRRALSAASARSSTPSRSASSPGWATEDVALRPPHQPLLARHGGRRPRPHLLQPRARLVPARRGRALAPQAAPGDRDRPHRPPRRLRPAARRRGVRVEDVPLGHAHRRGVVALRPQRPAPRQHQRRRQGPRHPLRHRPPHRADALDARHRSSSPLPSASSSRTSRFFIGSHVVRASTTRSSTTGCPTSSTSCPTARRRASARPGRRRCASTCRTTSTTTSSGPRSRGPMFWKVLLGNWLAETLRDVYSAATIFCGHVGHDVDELPGRDARPTAAGSGTRCRSRRRTTSRSAGRCRSSAERSTGRSSTTSSPRSPRSACGEIAPEVRAICERVRRRVQDGHLGHDARARPSAHIGRLAGDGGVREVVRSMA